MHCLPPKLSPLPCFSVMPHCSKFTLTNSALFTSYIITTTKIFIDSFHCIVYSDIDLSQPPNWPCCPWSPCTSRWWRIRCRRAPRCPAPRCWRAARSWTWGPRRTRTGQALGNTRPPPAPSSRSGTRPCAWRTAQGQGQRRVNEAMGTGEGEPYIYDTYNTYDIYNIYI